MDVDKTTEPVPAPAWPLGPSWGSEHERVRPILELLGSMNSVAAPHTPKAAGLTGCVGGCVAALAFRQTGLIAAVPAAMGLTALAASDLATHRFSLRALRVAAVFVVIGLVLDTMRASDWHRLAVTAAVTGLVAITLLATWLVTAGVAFGDLVLVTFTVLVPAWLSPRAAATTILTTLLFGAAAATVQRHGRPAGSPPGSIALGPALLLGWIVGVIVG